MRKAELSPTRENSSKSEFVFGRIAIIHSVFVCIILQQFEPAYEIMVGENVLIVHFAEAADSIADVLNI